VDSVKTNKHIFKKFSPSSSEAILVFFTKWHGNIPTPPPMGASNVGVVGRNRDSEPISDFIACCQLCDGLSVINKAPPDRGKL